MAHPAAPTNPHRACGDFSTPYPGLSSQFHSQQTMIEPSRRNLIEDLSMRLLKRADALDVFPTPVDRLITIADLVLCGELDLLNEPRTALPVRLRDGWGRLRRLTGRSPALVHLDLADLPPQKNLLSRHNPAYPARARASAYGGFCISFLPCTNSSLPTSYWPKCE